MWVVAERNEGLRKWKEEDRIPIVGTVKVAVPEATNQHSLARIVSELIRGGAAPLTT